jgi:hypothetical protein
MQLCQLVFGFSVGDFVAALELVADVVDALHESGDAGKRYRELVRQLDGLESVLLRVKRLEVDDAQHADMSPSSRLHRNVNGQLMSSGRRSRNTSPRLA